MTKCIHAVCSHTGLCGMQKQCEEEIKQMEDWEKKLLDQRFCFAEPAVKGLKKPYEPEIMFAGAQWEAGPSCETREEAQKVAQIYADRINDAVKDFATELSSKMKKAKP